MRWAIVIDSEFAITKLPTNSAMPPNASRKSWRKLRKLSVSLASSRACASLVRTCVPGGRICWISLASCCGVIPGFAFARIWSSFPGFSKSFCAGLEVEAGERRAAEARGAAELHEPRDAHLPHGAVRLHADRLTDLEVLLLRRRLVDHDLVRERPRAVDQREGVERGPGRVDAEAEVRRAAEDDHLAVAPDQVRLAADAAHGVRDIRQARAPCRAATRRTAAPSCCSRCSEVNADLPVTVASVPL